MAQPPQMIVQFAAEGLVLRLPDPITPSTQISYEIAMNILLRAAGRAQAVPFAWTYIDKPADGTFFLIFLPPGVPFPVDGIRYLDTETKMIVPNGGGGPPEMEVSEIRCGFVPGAEPSASRVRRRFRLIKGGHPSLVLVHYGRGQSTHVPPNLLAQPVRPYPLPPIQHPSIYVSGEKQGQKVYPQGMGPSVPGAGPGPGMGGVGVGVGGVGVGGMGMHGGGGGAAGMGGMGMGGAGVGMGAGMGGMGPGMGGNMGGMGAGMGAGVGGMPFNQQQAMLAQANSNMEMLERKRQREQDRERERAAQAARAPQQQRVMDDDDSGDEVDMISARTLAKTRYQRNHDWMNEVFMQAAFGKTIQFTKPPPGPIFVKEELDEKVAKLQAEVEALQSRAAQRRADRIRDSQSGTGTGEAPDQIMA